ncbi:lipase 1-like [Anticarsia gemmatalis]|uniref:lipase 1-like n=1 Tax=Anticarsia gemmatalis TaxID=129554 RepID=UPI003F767F77
MINVLTVLLLVCSSEVFTQTLRFDNEDAVMTFDQLAMKYLEKVEIHDVRTDGGYVLALFRIPGDVTKPLLFVHGAVDSSDSFIMRGNTSLAVALSRDNYDVWAINLRGNRYSRRHDTMNPDIDRKYWDFSLHEFGYHDLPSTIDYILNKTNQQSLSTIGYSEGTASMYVLGATRPEYNEKVKIFISLAPISYMHNAESYMSIIMDLAPVINEAYLAAGNEEVLGFNSPIKALMNALCLQKKIGYEICLLNGLFLLAGAHQREIEPDFFPVIIGHFPSGTSRKNLEHLTQIRSRRRFANYDYGPAGNMVEYNTEFPPDYDLSKVTMKIALVSGKNDKVSTIKDVALLRKMLPNVVDYKVMKSAEFNHVDFVWGRNTHKTMFPYIFKVLNKYQ